jgi:hypothetical protein
MTQLCGGKYWGMASCHFLYNGNCDCGLPRKPTLKSLAARVEQLEAILKAKETPHNG